MYDAALFGLHVVRNYGHYQLVRCPFHDDKHPSAIFLVNNGVFYCYVCHRREVMASGGGEEIDQLPGKRVELADLGKPAAIIDSTAPLSNEAIKYLKSRNIAIELAEEYGLRWDLHRDAIAFRLYDGGGRLAGIVRRVVRPAPEGSRYYLEGQRTPFWPLAKLADALHHPLFISEGAFKAMRIAQVARAQGKQIVSVATMGSQIQPAAIDLIYQCRRPVVFVGDNDNPGRNAMECLWKKVLHVHCLVPRKQPFDEADEQTAHNMFAQIWRKVEEKEKCAML
jgi:hypothetical protein